MLHVKALWMMKDTDTSLTDAKCHPYPEDGYFCQPNLSCSDERQTNVPLRLKFTIKLQLIFTYKCNRFWARLGSKHIQAESDNIYICHLL